jgi:hypothetical protein
MPAGLLLLLLAAAPAATSPLSAAAVDSADATEPEGAGQLPMFISCKLVVMTPAAGAAAAGTGSASPGEGWPGLLLLLLLLAACWACATMSLKRSTYMTCRPRANRFGTTGSPALPCTDTLLLTFSRPAH